MKISFIIVTNNRYDVLAETLTNLTALGDINYEIIVVDNNSQDATEATVKQFTKVKYIKLDYNSGEWEGRNIAMRHATGELICSLDDDSFPDTNSVREAIHQFNITPTLGIISMDVMDYDTHYGKLKLKYTPPVEVLAFIACGAIFRRDLLKQVGMWENWFSGGIEHSFSIRTLNAGYMIKRFYNVYVYHHMTPKSRQSIERLQHHSENIYKLYETYYGFWGAIPNCFKILQRGILVDLAARRWLFTKGFLDFCKLGRTKQYPIKSEVLAQVRMPLRVEGYRFETKSDVGDFNPPKRILLVRTRPVQLLSKYIKSIKKIFPHAKIDLLTHRTNTSIPTIFNHVITYPGIDQFEYTILHGVLDELMHSGIKYNLILFCAENLKVIGGYENIQRIAHKMHVQLGSIGVNSELIKYTTLDLIKVNTYKIISTILAPILFIRYLIRFKRRPNYYFESYNPVQ